MCGNYSREETIQGRKLYEEIRYSEISNVSFPRLPNNRQTIWLTKKLQLLTQWLFLAFKCPTTVCCLIGGNFEDNNNLIRDILIGSYFCFLAWYNSPIVTVLETLTYPIEELPFPTVTVCPRDSNPDRWGPTIKLFDFLNRRCGSDR